MMHHLVFKTWDQMDDEERYSKRGSDIIDAVYIALKNENISVNKDACKDDPDWLLELMISDKKCALVLAVHDSNPSLWNLFLSQERWKEGYCEDEVYEMINPLLESSVKSLEFVFDLMWFESMLDIRRKFKQNLLDQSDSSARNKE